MLSEVLLAYPLINRARVPRWVFFSKSIYSGIARVRESIIPIARFRPFGCSPSATSQIEPIFVMTSCSMRTCHSFLLMHPTGLHHDIRRLKHLSRTHCCCLTQRASLFRRLRLPQTQQAQRAHVKLHRDFTKLNHAQTRSLTATV
jgi:hypothetical protein